MAKLKQAEEYKPSRIERFLESFVVYALAREIKEHGGSVEECGPDGPYLVTIDFGKKAKHEKDGFFSNLRKGFKKYLK